MLCYLLHIIFPSFIYGNDFSLLILRNLKQTFFRNENLTLNTKSTVQRKLLAKNINIIHDNNLFLSVIGLSVFWEYHKTTMAVYPSFAKMYMQNNRCFCDKWSYRTFWYWNCYWVNFYSRMSKHYIEVGTIPWATFGMAVTLYFSTASQIATTAAICFYFLEYLVDFL